MRFKRGRAVAYHEFEFIRAGIQVFYCGEQFENDGSSGTNIRLCCTNQPEVEFSFPLNGTVPRVEFAAFQGR